MCLSTQGWSRIWIGKRNLKSCNLRNHTESKAPQEQSFKTQFQQHPPAVHSCISLGNLRSRKNIQQKVASQNRRHNISRYINSHGSNCAGTQRRLENYQPKHKYCTLRATIAATAEKKTSEQWVSYSLHDKLVATFLLLPPKTSCSSPLLAVCTADLDCQRSLPSVLKIQRQIETLKWVHDVELLGSVLRQSLIVVTTNKQKPLLQLHAQKSKPPLDLWVHLHEDERRRAAAKSSSTKNPLKNKQQKHSQLSGLK